MNKNINYLIFKEPGKESISNGDRLRVDLFNGFKIKDIPELKGFKIKYCVSGHKWGNNFTRYIQVYN